MLQWAFKGRLTLLQSALNYFKKNQNKTKAWLFLLFSFCVLCVLHVIQLSCYMEKGNTEDPRGDRAAFFLELQQ